MATRNIYAIVDLIAQDILGGLHLAMHDAVAVRLFSDVAQMQGSLIEKHPEDFSLVRLGHIVSDNGDIRLFDEPETVLTGKAWAAAREAANRPQSEQLHADLR